MEAIDSVSENLGDVITIDNFVENTNNYSNLVKLEDIKLSENPIDRVTGSLIIPSKYKYINNEADFIQENYNNILEFNFPYIWKILLNVEGVVLCGSGALWPCIKTYTPNDFDLFLYGESDIVQDQIKIKKIIDIIKEYKNNIVIYMVKGVITIISYVTIQIILRNRYYSISDILNSFDISCCKVAWDGKYTYFTESAVFSITKKMNIVIPEQRSKTYEIRLKKYFDRGFALLFPNLDISTALENELHLPNLSIKFYYKKDNIAIGNIFLPILDTINLVLTKNDNDCDYDIITKSYIIDIKHNKGSIKLIEKNCQKILRDVYNFEILVSNNSEIKLTYKIIDIVPMWYYQNWIYSYIKQYIVVDYGEYILNEDFLKILIGDHYEEFAKDNCIPRIKEQLKEVNKRIYSLNILNAKIFILQKLITNVFNYIIDKYKQIYNNDIHFYIDIENNMGSSSNEDNTNTPSNEDNMGHSFVEDGIKSSVEDGIKSSVEDGIKSSVEDGIKSSVEDEIKSSVEDEIKSSVEDGIKSSVEDGIKSSVEDEIKSSVEDEIKSSVEDEIKSSVEDEIKSSIKNKKLSTINASLHPLPQSGEEWYGDYYNSVIHFSSSINNFIKHYLELANEKICPLCYQIIHYLANNISILSCGHIYHEYGTLDCEGINKWIKINNSCPECRKKKPLNIEEF